MIFLQTRPMQPDVGTLLVSLENGNIQVWSHHSAGGYIGCFFAIHVAGDYVVAMNTDPKNEYLFTGVYASDTNLEVKILHLYRAWFTHRHREKIFGGQTYSYVIFS